VLLTYNRQLSKKMRMNASCYGHKKRERPTHEIDPFRREFLAPHGQSSSILSLASPLP
jgi:hypothetical protein